MHFRRGKKTEPNLRKYLVLKIVSTIDITLHQLPVVSLIKYTL